MAHREQDRHEPLDSHRSASRPPPNVADRMASPQITRARGRSRDLLRIVAEALTCHASGFATLKEGRKTGNATFAVAIPHDCYLLPLELGQRPRPRPPILFQERTHPEHHHGAEDPARPHETNTSTTTASTTTTSCSSTPPSPPQYGNRGASSTTAPIEADELVGTTGAVSGPRNLDHWCENLHCSHIDDIDHALPSGFSQQDVRPLGPLIWAMGSGLPGPIAANRTDRRR